MHESLAVQHAESARARTLISCSQPLTHVLFAELPADPLCVLLGFMLYA